LEGAYGEQPGYDLSSGFRILPTNEKSDLPAWTKSFLTDDKASFDKVRYLLTFRPFSKLPAAVVSGYFAGELALLPFPEAWYSGMPTYLKLQKKLPLAMQIPLLKWLPGTGCRQSARYTIGLDA